jgi:hypothetical protein
MKPIVPTAAALRSPRFDTKSQRETGTAQLVHRAARAPRSSSMRLSARGARSPTPKEGAYVHGVLIGGEGLQRGPRDVLATLLHEGLTRSPRCTASRHQPPRALPQRPLQAHRRGSQTRRRARQHDRMVADLSLPATATTYAATIEDLERAITLHRRRPAASCCRSSRPRTRGPSDHTLSLRRLLQHRHRAPGQGGLCQPPAGA